MKNKLLVVLIVLLFVGCGKTADKKQKNNPNDLSYYMVSYVTEKLDEENTKVYIIIENTSENTGKIAKINYVVLDEGGTEPLHHGTLEYNKEFASGEQEVVIFDVPLNIDKVTNILVTPLYKSGEEIKFVSKQKEYEQVQAEVVKRKMKKAKEELTLVVKFTESKEISKLRIEVNNANGYPACVGYIDIDDTVKKDEEYTYKFKCSTSTDTNGSVIFESEK